MAMFVLHAEHVGSFNLGRIRAWAADNKIRITKATTDEIFSGAVHIRVKGDTKRVANKLRDFIWNEINGGAAVEIRKVK